jgi:hypothetical protein
VPLGLSRICRERASESVESAQTVRIWARWGCSKAVQKYAALGLFFLLAAGAAAQTPDSALPDLDVTWISVSPRYPAYTVREVEGLPRVVDPATDKVLPPDEADRIQRWPHSGEDVTATARVVNHGSAPAGGFHYKWSLNGKVVAEGRCDGLAADCQATAETSELKVGNLGLRECALAAGSWVDLTLPFKWKKGQALRLEVKLEDANAKEQGAAPDPKSELPPIRNNNTLEERTDALSFLIAVPRSSYNAWAKLRSAGRTAGFEDWVQGQMEALRGRLASSIYPEAPQGVDLPIRVDRISVLADGENPLQLADEAAPAGWDGAWFYPDTRVPAEDAAENPTDLDGVFEATLLRQMGVADLDRLVLLPDQVHLQPPALAGFIPVEAVISANNPLPEHMVLGLNRTAGKRRGFRGSYALDLPRQCRLRVLDNNGRIIPEAKIELFQKGDTGIRPEPLSTGMTNSEGTYPIPNRPAKAFKTADGFELVDNPFGQLTLLADNGVLLAAVTVGEQRELFWLPITRFNLAQWHGQGKQAVIELRTRFPAIASPAPPEGLTVKPAREVDQDGMRLEWKPAAGSEIGGFAVYRASYPTYQWERLAAVTRLRSRFFDPSVPDQPTRYAVAAITLDGDESALTEVTVATGPAQAQGKR